MPATVYDAIFGAFSLRQIVSTNVDAGVGVGKQRYSGGLDPQLVSVVKLEPKVSLDSADLGGVLTAVSVTAGLALTGTSIVLPWNGRADGGTFQGSGAHFSLSATRGLLIPTEFSAEQDAEEGAKAALEFTPTYDGSTEILVANVNQSLSAQAFNAGYDLGPLKINGTAVPGLKRTTVKTGLTLEIVRYAGQVRSEKVSIKMREPTIECSFEDGNAVAAFVALFNTISATAVCYYRKRADGAVHVADGSSVHIAFTLTGGVHVAESYSGSKQDNAEFKRVLHGKTLAASAAAAIS